MLIHYICRERRSLGDVRPDFSEGSALLPFLFITLNDFRNRSLYGCKWMQGNRSPL